jgi:hypothetical protein
MTPQRMDELRAPGPLFELRNEAADEIEALRKQCSESIAMILAQVKENKKIIDEATARLGGRRPVGANQ